jgi:hypothetical protein
VGDFFFIENETIIIYWEKDFLYRIVSAVERMEFVSYRVSYTVLRGRWFINVLNAHSLPEEKVMI